jgi:aspartate/methionine/tyrosine aminotransferase
MTSLRVQGLRPAKIGALSQLAASLPQVLNLGEGFPDFPLHPALIESWQWASQQPVHQHTDGAGLPGLRQWVADYLPYNNVCPESQITITCGATQALQTTLVSLLNPGDEVVVLEPFYEPYLNMIRLAGGVPRLVRLHPPDWRWQDLTCAFNPKTRALLLNSPHNPTGRHFTGAELAEVSQLCSQWGSWLLHDAVYTDWTAQPMVWPVVSDRLVTIGSFSKSLGITGWRLGYVAAPASLTPLIRQVHEHVTCEAPVPLQAAVCHALTHYPTLLAQRFNHAAPYRRAMLDLLHHLEAEVFEPEGAVYAWANMPSWGKTASEAAMALLQQKNLLGIPADCFYEAFSPGPWLRWCYLKTGLLGQKTA